MISVKKISRPSLLIAAILFASSECVARNGSRALFRQGVPEVLKAEPPNWWTGHSITPVRVMIRGLNLAGAQVAAAGAGLSVVGQPEVNANGTYLFVDLSIAGG